MKASVSFRLLERADFPSIQAWLSEPHVAAWWNERLDLAGVEAKYGPRVDRAEPVHMFVIEQAGRPIGWVQWYRWSDFPEHAGRLGAPPDAAGIDLAIGEPGMTGVGLSPAAIRELIERIVFSNPDVQSVVCDPEADNLRSLRAFEKAGFIVLRTIRLPGEERDRRVVHFERS